VGVQLSLASYILGKVEHLPGSLSLDHGDGPDPETHGLLYGDEVMLLLFREYHINIVYNKMMNIAGIKRMARQLNIDMISKGILCLPRDVRKYTGTIHRVERAGGTVVWVVHCF